MKTNDDIVKEFDGIFVNKDGYASGDEHYHKLKSFLRTILAAKDAEIERARQEGRDEAVDYIHPRWHAIDNGRMTGDIDDHCDAARKHGTPTS